MGLSNGGLPSTNNYTIGRGILRLDLFADGGAATGKYRDLGNVTAFSLSLEEESLDHEASMSGLKTIDASVTLSKSMKGSFTLDELSAENQQLFFSGDLNEYTQGAISYTGVTGGTANLTVPANGAGYWYPLYWDDAVDPVFDVRGNKRRARGVVVDQADKAGGGDLFEGVDYAVDKEAGLFQPLVGGGLDSVSPVVVDLDITIDGYTGASNSIREILPLERTVVRGRLMFIGENAQTGEKYEVFLNRVKLASDGDAQFIGDDFSEMPFTFTAEADVDYDSVAPTGRITRIPTSAD